MNHMVWLHNINNINWYEVNIRKWTTCSDPVGIMAWEVSYLSWVSGFGICGETYAYIQWVTRVNLVISIMLQGSSFPKCSHIMWIRDKFIHSYNNVKSLKVWREEYVMIR